MPDQDVIPTTRLAEQVGYLRALEVPCPPERCAVVEVILDVRVGPPVEQESHHRHIAPLRRQVQRRDALAVVRAAERRPPVDLCAMVEQPARRLGATLRRRPEEWGATVGIGVDVGALTRQQLILMGMLTMYGRLDEVTSVLSPWPASG